jgi:hypothetical protein
LTSNQPETGVALIAWYSNCVYANVVTLDVELLMKREGTGDLSASQAAGTMIFKVSLGKCKGAIGPLHATLAGVASDKHFGVAR